MEVFRRSEKRCVEIQEQVALDSFHAKQEREHGMLDLFKEQDDAGLDAFERWRDTARVAAKAQFEEWLSGGMPRGAEHLRAELMQHPHVDSALVNGWAREAEKAGRMTRTTEDGSRTFWHPIPIVTPE